MRTKTFKEGASRRVFQLGNSYNVRWSLSLSLSRARVRLEPSRSERGIDIEQPDDSCACLYPLRVASKPAAGRSQRRQSGRADHFVGRP